MIFDMVISVVSYFNRKLIASSFDQLPVLTKNDSSDRKSRKILRIYDRKIYSGGSFLHGFWFSEKKDSRISEEKMTKISDYVFFVVDQVIFLQKREIVAHFCL